MRRAHTIPADPRIMTDGDVARMLGVSTRTVRERVKNPREGEVDLRKASPRYFGGRRYWFRDEVERTIGVIPQSALLGALKAAKAKGGGAV